MVNIEPVLYIGTTQSFFAGLLIATKKPTTTANRVMAAWLFMICIEMIFALLNSKVIEMYSFPFITFTYGPLLYLYISFMTTPGRKFNPVELIHFVPFVVFFTVSVVFRSEPLVRDLRGFFEPDKLMPLRMVYSVSFFLSITTYSILSFIKINKHQSNLMDLTSFTSQRITLNWLKVLAISFYVVYIIVFILGGLKILGNYIPFDPYFVVFAFIALFSMVYSFYGIKQPVIFGEVLHNERNGEKREAEKYSRSGLKDEQAEEYLTILLDYMESEKPYLDGNLTIHDLSLKTGISRHHITQVLNEIYGKNFFTFINEYRTREVIERFSDSRYDHYTILAIAFDSGFNSKSTFNSFFKSQTGQTPSKYRENLAGITE
ncbi:MAG: helix-turn-helix domain-containing protein [Bacteroidales bacterium]|jgi:AraC-like DNA-binding protein|nr:helix-turn-helix domain-containing protein [Bacteroidales bacterium]HNY52769.1 helix-turn-helix transcriptional regulator [Bacteroidales bacterium]HPX43054.1 helix-turn-helix transcriptional regulator [Bacteroidales bacterium]